MQDWICLRKMSSMFNRVHDTHLPKTVEVLSASDLNPKYLNCVEFYISSWLSIPTHKQVKFIPKVLLIADSIPDYLIHYSEYLQLIDADQLNSAYVSQTSRIIEGRNSRADFVMTSDIDMLPMSVEFETNIVLSDIQTNETFYILRDVLEPGQYPICYNLAKPTTWNLLLADYGDYVPTSTILRQILNEFGGPAAYSGIHGGAGWTIDQQKSWSVIQRTQSGFFVKSFTDRETSHRRLDRAHHRGIIKWLVLPLVFLGFFHDYHVHHPVEKHKNYIRILLNLRNFGLGMRSA